MEERQIWRSGMEACFDEIHLQASKDTHGQGPLLARAISHK